MVLFDKVSIDCLCIKFSCYPAKMEQQKCSFFCLADRSMIVRANHWKKFRYYVFVARFLRLICFLCSSDNFFLGRAGVRPGSQDTTLYCPRWPTPTSQQYRKLPNSRPIPDTNFQFQRIVPRQRFCQQTSGQTLPPSSASGHVQN